MKNTEIQTSRIQSAGSALKSAGNTLIVFAVCSILSPYAILSEDVKFIQGVGVLVAILSIIAYIALIGYLKTSGEHLELCMTEILKQNAQSTTGLRTVDGLFIVIRTTGIEPNVVKEAFIDGLVAPDGEYEIISQFGMRIVVQDGKIIG